MANPGYGKRSAPAQPPRSGRDFAHLAPREAYVAGYLDRLPDGAAIDVKTLAKALPNYGQRAVRNALNALAEAGHYRNVCETIGDGRPQWVRRTYFSRQARSDAWWTRFLAGEEPDVESEEHAADTELTPRSDDDDRDDDPPPSAPRRWARAVRDALRVHHSEAYRALATLGGRDTRLALSAEECAALEALAQEWLERGVTVDQFVRTMAVGLPQEVHCPGAFVRTRLIRKLPPEQPAPQVQPRREHLILCTNCERPGLPRALPDGLCRPCRRELGLDQPPSPDLAAEVTHRVNQLRAALRGPSEPALAAP